MLMLIKTLRQEFLLLRLPEVLSLSTIRGRPVLVPSLRLRRLSEVLLLRWWRCLGFTCKALQCLDPAIHSLTCSPEGYILSISDLSHALVDVLRILIE